MLQTLGTAQNQFCILVNIKFLPSTEHRRARWGYSFHGLMDTPPRGSAPVLDNGAKGHVVMKAATALCEHYAAQGIAVSVASFVAAFSGTGADDVSVIMICESDHAEQILENHQGQIVPSLRGNLKRGKIMEEFLETALATELDLWCVTGQAFTLAQEQALTNLWRTLAARGICDESLRDFRADCGMDGNGVALKDLSDGRTACVFEDGSIVFWGAPS